MEKLIRRFPKIISKDEVIKLILTIAKSKRYDKYGAGKFLRLRDATLQMLLFYTGLRPGEAINLKWSDIHFEERMIDVNPYHNKERNEMSAVLTKPAEQVILDYKSQIEEMQIKSEFLFPSLWTWKPMTVDGMGKRFREICKEAGLNNIKYYTDLGMPKYQYNLYSYRRKFGTEVYNKTNDFMAVMRLMRLLQPSSIPRYVIYSDEKRIKIADDVFNSSNS